MDAQNDNLRVKLLKEEKKEIVEVALKIFLRTSDDPTEVYRAITKTKMDANWNASAMRYLKKKEKSIKELALEILEDIDKAKIKIAGNE